MKTHLTLKSANAKTGPIHVSTSSNLTCPPSCPFKSNGCYASGGPLALHWAKVTAGLRGLDWEEFCQAITSLPDGQLWRHNQAGDLPGAGEYIDASKLALLVGANKGRNGFTYTHKTGTQENLEAIRSANDNGFTVNLSANTLEHADRLSEENAGPVVCVLPSETKANLLTPAGRKVVICPATQREGVSCATCKLCSKGNRSVIIGFPAHGASQRKASAVASN